MRNNTFMITFPNLFTKHTFLTVIIISVLLDSDLNSQSIGIGQPFIKTYTHKDYKSSRINWCIIQDKRGVIYAGNENGIIEFDGSSWRKIEVPNSEIVRAMDIDAKGTIYVCAATDFGYLEHNSKGLLQYKSLLPYLDKKYHNFGEIWDVCTTSHGIFFKNDDKVFRWDGSEIMVWDSIYAFRLYNIGDRIYSRNQETGLMILDGDSIKLMPDGEFFADIGVYNMLPFVRDGEEDKILITTNNDGLFLHDGKKFHPFETDIDSYLSENQIYNACITSDDKVAISTQRGGVIIIDKNGKMQKIINKNNGLPTDVVYDVWPDPKGGLWLATTDGVVHLEIPSSFSILNKSVLQEDQSNSIIRFEEKLYVTNSIGIFYFSDTDKSFKLLKGSDREASDLMNANGTLLCVNNDGIAIIKEDRIVDIIYENAIELYNSKIFTNRFYVGTDTGFLVLQKVDKDNFSVSYSKEFYSPVTGFIEDSSNLWIEGGFRGIYQVTGKLDELKTGSEENIKYNYFSVKDDLPGLNLGIHNILDRVFLSTDNGMFIFNKESNSFLSDSTFGNIFFDSTYTVSLVQKNFRNDLWIVLDSSGQMDLGKAILQSNGRYNWKPIPEFRRLNLNSVVSLYPDFDNKNNKEILWIISEESLIIYNPNLQNDVTDNFTTLIRKININSDSLIYGGVGNLENSEENGFELTFNNNNIGFEFSATSLDKPEANKFQYFLNGNDEDWSNWTNETKKGYTNLSSGDYSFQLRSKNIYGKISTAEIFNFKILSPWYLTWWAYSIYFLLIILGIFITDRIMRAKVIKKERDKSKLVEAEYRAETAELQAKAAEAQSKVIQAENDRKTKELEEARQLQLSMLPKSLPNTSGLDIAVYMQTATEVGGDYYDFSTKEDGTLNIALGDATGHGMKAGTLVSMMKSLFIANSINKGIQDFFISSNNALKNSKLDKMMMAFAMLSIQGRKIKISNAAIPPIYIFRKDKKYVEEINVNGLPLGAMRNSKYPLYESELSRGDTVLMLSDGMPELQNKNQEMLGYERLVSMLKNIENDSASQIVEKLKIESLKWIGDQEPDDDVTFVVVKVE